VGGLVLLGHLTYYGINSGAAQLHSRCCLTHACGPASIDARMIAVVVLPHSIHTRAHTYTFTHTHTSHLSKTSKEGVADPRRHA